MKKNRELIGFLFNPPELKPVGTYRMGNRFAERLAWHPVDWMTHLGMVRSNAYHAAGCPVEWCDAAAARDLWALVYPEERICL